MTKKERAYAAVRLLEEEYPGATCSLDSDAPYRLLIAVRLAAQCTDARVNMVTPKLFERFPTLESLADSTPEEVGEYIKSCGLYRTKARDIVLMAQMLIKDYNGVVPDEMDELLKLPGVGRKTANLILGDVYKKPAVVCDTHCIRITNLLGLSDSKDPYKVEMQLRDCLPMDKANDFCHRLVIHGRAVCIARHPKCGDCVMSGICEYACKNNLGHKEVITTG